MYEHPIVDWSPKAFSQLAEEYSVRCAQGFPPLLTAVAKWRHEDLIPGLSDIDLRFLCSDVDAEGWTEFDESVGQVHLKLVCEHPEWARKLEHTPGICLTFREALDPLLYQPEMHQWDYWYGDPHAFFQVKEYLRQRAWGERDEYYHLRKRWLMFWGPYNREIDPPINIAPAIEAKYALHSRAMHYFVPSLQAALSLIERKAIHGKREALYRWLERYPNERVLNETMEMLGRYYEVPALTDREEMYGFEERCFAFLRKITPQVMGAVTIVDVEPGEGMARLKAKLDAFPADPLLTIYRGLCFSRIRRGRYYFYLNAPRHFDTDWLFRNEIVWLGNVMTGKIFDAYARLRWGQSPGDLDATLDRLTPQFLHPEEAAIVKELFRMGKAHADYAQARASIERAMGIYQPYYLVLERVLCDARRLASERDRG